MKTIVVPHYELFRKNGRMWGRVLQDYAYQTPITGYNVSYSDHNCDFTLSDTGILQIRRMSEWDFGSGPSLQTNAMVYASLPHDMFCHLTNRRIIPWKERKSADLYFWDCLTDAGATVSRIWRIMGVVSYSQLIARWKDKK
jgi:hypothetical protein